MRPLIRGPRNDWIGRGLLLLAVVALIAGAFAWWPRTVDDAFIIFRYADNLAHGSGPVWNAGDRLEGYTSPSWMLLSAAAIAVGLDPVPVSKVAGIVCSLALLLVLYRRMRNADASGLAAGSAALLVGSSLVFGMWSVAGLETNAFALLFFLGLALLSSSAITPRVAVGASTLLVAASLTRPEGLAFWALGLPTVVTGVSRDRRAVVLAYLAPGLLIVAHFLWRFSYYGDLLPNTYHAKTGGGLAMWLQGLHGLRGFVAHPAHLVWLAAAAAGTVIGLRSASQRRCVAVMSAATLLYLVYIVSVGDDGLRMHRFYVPLLAPLALCAGMLFDMKHRAPVIAGAAAVVLTVGASLWAGHGRMVPRLADGTLVYLEGNVKLGRHLAGTRAPTTVVAVVSAGAIPYYSRLPTIDMYGLNDRRIAHAPFPEAGKGRLMRWDNADVLSRRPDLIAINRGYFRAGDPMIDEVARRPTVLAPGAMDRDLFRRVSQDGGYGLRALRFADGSVFFVFERVR